MPRKPPKPTIRRTTRKASPAAPRKPRPAGAASGKGSTSSLLQLFVESVVDYGLYLLDTEGRILSWNAGARHITGYEIEEAIGQHMAILFTPEEVSAGRPAVELATAAHVGRVESEGWRVRKDGGRYWADVVLTALFSLDRKLLGYAAVARDLTERRAADELLRQSEERFRLMVASVKDYAIFMLDADGHVQSWNQGAQRIKGYEAREIIGRHMCNFYPPEDREAGKPFRLLALAAREGRVEDEGWRLRKDGTRFWADVVLTAIRGPAGELRGYAKVTRDLTERRAAEENLRQSEERFRLMLEGVHDYAIFMLDREGRVTTWNEGARRIKGYETSEILHQHFSRFYTPEDLAANKPARELEIASREGKYEEEGWRVRKDGGRFWASVIITAVHDAHGTLVGYAKVTRDLTERRRAEEERLRLAQANEAIRLRDEFLSIASHELKTPLTALQLQLEALHLRTGSADPKVSQKVDRAARSAMRLAALVEALLDVSRIATGKFTLDPEELNVRALLSDVVERVSESAIQARCEVEVHADPELKVSWDRLRVEQVLLNLLTNAFKYAAGTPVRIDATGEGDQVVLAVSDQGPGVPDEAAERIFQRFERAASMRHFGGLGLGLYVSRQIVEAHGGEISVEKNQPQGARFVIKLPQLAHPRPIAPPPQRDQMS